MALNDYLVKPNAKFKLGDYLCNDKSITKANKADLEAELANVAAEISAVQDVIYAENKHKVLLVLQGMDGSGKDGTVKHVFSECDPLGIRTVNFKAPTEEELAHDYLWRIHKEVPKKGEITIFNRSHYEDVLIVKVHNWIDAAECKRRYAQINDFERLLAETGTTIIKCFLNISKAEQKVRLQKRLEDNAKNWKFNPKDVDERALWDDYMKAYEDAIAATSKNYAPWYIVPADSKTGRNLAISQILLANLKALKPSYPLLSAEVKGTVIPD
ncbi:MAG: polyphosphate kinase 2 family protein [Methylophilaceae bacterium]